MPADYDFITDRLAIGDVASRSTPGFCAVVSLLSSSPFDEQYKAPVVPEGVPMLLIDQRDGGDGHARRSKKHEATHAIG